MVPGLAEDPVGFDAAAAAATTATAAATSTASANDVPQDEAVEAVARAAREHYGRLVALLAATGADITAAEDAWRTPSSGPCAPGPSTACRPSRRRGC
ncbi:hypothetical protein [Arsenicicoccus piscis]|uniref:Uncharacterized protein n=1 Tax=Arsenicicoccus piscis TaxID=673954 RepID=A0ABQ6HS41_9MICO|nr:hypothetical protein [Arsenicicoccus piscis]GMA21298.1 hypothetical protein GCM10025862_33190 [Arsenicicoccus piscis]